jgi:hypothetical protein
MSSVLLQLLCLVQRPGMLYRVVRCCISCKEVDVRVGGCVCLNAAATAIAAREAKCATARFTSTGCTFGGVFRLQVLSSLTVDALCSTQVFSPQHNEVHTSSHDAPCIARNGIRATNWCWQLRELRREHPGNSRNKQQQRQQA